MSSIQKSPLSSVEDVSESRKKDIYKVTLIGSLGNMFLLLFKLIAGIVGHSAAMIADAVHSLSDFATDLVVLIFVRISSKPRDEGHDYGHGKYETLATAIIALALFAVGVMIMVKGIEEVVRFARGEELEAPGMIAFIAAIVSILVKEFLYQFTLRTAKRVKSDLVKANAWHHRSDAFSSIGTALGIGGAIFLGVKGRVLDPIAAIIVSVFILKVGVQLIRPSIAELLEKSLPAEEEKRIMEILRSTAGVYSPHNLRTRRIGSYAAVDVHIRMDADMTVRDSHQVTKNIEEALRAYLGPHTITNIHVEPYEKS